MTTNRKILATGALTLLIAFVVSLTPWYRAYMHYDHRWTCAKLRKVIELRYPDAVQEMAAQYAPDAPETVEAALRRANDTIDYTFTESDIDGVLYEASGACRDGGVFLIRISDNGYISVRCSLEEHDIDYTQIPEY